LKRFAPGAASLHDPPTGFVDLAAVVTVSDDGGSSGRLRREFEILAPGDIRNCMVALAEDAALLSRLFQYRFSLGRGLQGHSFGNLFLTALTHVTGDFHQAIQLSSEVLAIRGRIYPSTLENVRLEAKLASGRTIRGESKITAYAGHKDPIRTIRLHPRRCRPLPETLAAIAQADLITLGPGSLYTSVIPNLLVEGIPEAIAASPALKVYVANLMWEPGETEGYSAADHLQAIYQHAEQVRADYVVVNSGRVPDTARRRYEREHARPVKVDAVGLRRLGARVVRADLLGFGEIVRHDPAKLANVLVGMALRQRLEKRPAG
jgi:uncharacterized cofD-like protein